MKKATINTVTAGALAGQILSSINAKSEARKRTITAAVKADPKYKKLMTIRKKAKDLSNQASDLAKELEEKHCVSISSYSSDISVSDKSVRPMISRDGLADEIIVLHNVKGKSAEAITTELIKKYS